MRPRLKRLHKKHAEKVRFGTVGAANTALDFILLFLLTSLGLNSVLSNYISTSIAFLSSFFFNKTYAFKSVGGNVRKQLGMFMAVTIAGIWIIQPIIIVFVESMFAGGDQSDEFVLLVAKGIATIASSIWNYLWYSRVVFKR